MPLSPVCKGKNRTYICGMCGRPPHEPCPRHNYDVEDRHLIDEGELERRLKAEYDRGYKDGKGGGQ